MQHCFILSEESVGAAIGRMNSSDIQVAIVQVKLPEPIVKARYSSVKNAHLCKKWHIVSTKSDQGIGPSNRVNVCISFTLRGLNLDVTLG